MMLRPFASGKERDCPLRRSGSGLHEVDCKVCGFSISTSGLLLELLGSSFLISCSDRVSLFFGVAGRTYPWGNRFQANRSNLWQVRLLTN